ncbi:MAG: ABC transporter ATP-binding protein [Eubacteriales bacterium]|nr:ABC transporter ATP-binding protein [Eubacteriales bacterium]
MFSIETKKLTKTYGSLKAVDTLDLTVNEGELFSLLGVNGAGKTTVIKMLTCLSLPTSGEAFIKGINVINEPEKVKSIVGISPQETAVALNLTVRENLEFIAGIYGVADPKGKATKLIAMLRLEEKEQTRAAKLSGGQQRRLSIAMGLISQPEVLFLDEPTLGLDVLARRELWSILRALKGKITIILTTHYLEEAEALSDRIGVMSKGRLLAVGTPGELMTLTQKTNFEDAFVALASEERCQL